MCPCLSPYKNRAGDHEVINRDTVPDISNHVLSLFTLPSLSFIVTVQTYRKIKEECPKPPSGQVLVFYPKNAGKPLERFLIYRGSHPKNHLRFEDKS